MKLPETKHIIILLLSVFLYPSCRAKKTFNGASTLECADHNKEISEQKETKKSRWRLVLYKDGRKVVGKSKKGKSRLFKKKD